MARTKIAITAFALSLGIASPAFAERAFLDSGPGLDTAGQFILASQAVGAARGLQATTGIDPFLEQRVEKMGQRLEGYGSPVFTQVRKEAAMDAMAGNWTEKKIEGYLDAAEMSFTDLRSLVRAAIEQNVGPADDNLMWHVAVETMGANYAPTAPAIEGMTAMARLELAVIEVSREKPINNLELWASNGRDLSHVPVMVAAASIGMTELAMPMTTAEFTRVQADPLAGIAKDAPVDPFEAAAAAKAPADPEREQPEDIGPGL